MSRDAILVGMASWEERFLLGARRVIHSGKTLRSILFFAEEFEDWTAENRAQYEDLCSKGGVELTSERVWLRSPEKTWGVLRRQLAGQTMSGREIVVDITTMPREIIWQVLAFAENMDCSIKYVYHKPETYNREWLSRDPERPRLVYKLSGLSEFGRPTTLIVLTGFDVRRTEQLIRFYEPKTTLLGIQVGAQLGNESQNIGIHKELIRPDAGIHSFDVDAYSSDRGKAAIFEQVRRYVDTTNLVMTSLGPKLSAVALYQLHKEFPSTALSYAPSLEYNLEYSKGIGETITGQL
jgi:hypothetical protein